MKAGNSERIKKVKDIVWMTNNETVRLKYLKMLADKFKMHEVNSIGSNDAAIEYDKTYKSEFDHVVQKIRNCQSLEEIKKYVNNYMTEVADVDYEVNLVNLEKYNTLKMQHEHLRDHIEKRLKEIHNSSSNSRSESFLNPSDDESIMKMLGCTSTCYWRGALCWGIPDIKIQMSLLQYHVKKSQMNGMYGTMARKNQQNGVLQKFEIFSEWKFEPHHQDQFNDLMCWFFEKLNHDLAKKRNRVPASYDELRKYGCINLDYYRII
ncbi:21062_t:CDS:2, partial [Gigaspora margarita]